jgi:hypothetical protein
MVIPKNMTNSLELLAFLKNTFGFSGVRQAAVLLILKWFSIETDDPVNMLKEYATSNHPWAIKFREFVKKAFGVDFSGPPPPLNENIVYWKKQNI